MGSRFNEPSSMISVLQLQSPRFGGFMAVKSSRLYPKKIRIAQESTTSLIKLQHETSTSTERTLNADIHLTDSPATARGTTAPLVDALRACAEGDIARFHFPGHNRGKAAPPLLSQLTGLGLFLHDLPDLPELDDLFSPKGVIFDAQRRAAQLFGARETWFLVGGTTCGIHASIMATCSPGDTLILPRNSHISAISGLVLSGAEPKYIMPEYSSMWDIAGGITPLQVEQAIKELEADGKRAAAVLITSPTYHGICSNVSKIMELCHSHGIPVIVDEAHGAHFKFHPELPRTALEQGADLAVQSTHKVLSSLTQSSMLHMLGGDLVDRDRVSRCLRTLQSSSPSYLLLASLDAARAQLGEKPDTVFDEAFNLSIETRYYLGKTPGISVLDLSSFASDFPSIDPLRITIDVSRLGISGYKADEVLCNEHRVVAELAGSKSVTFAFNSGTCREQSHRLVSGVKLLSDTYFDGNGSESRVGNGVCGPFTGISTRLSPREAFFAKKTKVGIGESIGGICGELICPYPPGIPVLIPGEVITEEALSYLLDVKRMGAAISGAADPTLSWILVCSV